MESEGSGAFLAVGRRGFGQGRPVTPARRSVLPAFHLEKSSLPTGQWSLLVDLGYAGWCQVGGGLRSVRGGGGEGTVG